MACQADSAGCERPEGRQALSLRRRAALRIAYPPTAGRSASWPEACGASGHAALPDRGGAGRQAEVGRGHHRLPFPRAHRGAPPLHFLRGPCSPSMHTPHRPGNGNGVAASHSQPRPTGSPAHGPRRQPKALGLGPSPAAAPGPAWIMPMPPCNKSAMFSRTHVAQDTWPGVT